MFGFIKRILNRQKSLHAVYIEIVELAKPYGIEVLLDGYKEDTLYITMIMPKGTYISNVEKLYKEISDIIGDYKVNIRVV